MTDTRSDNSGSISSVTRWLDRLILVVALVALSLLSIRLLSPVAEPTPAEPPLLALSGTFEGTAPASVVPSRTLTPQEKAVAEACLIEASRLIDRGSDAKALDWLRRAHAAAPGEPRYADALRIHENQIAARSSLRVLEDKLRAGKADEAWEEYLSKALHDRFYFLSTASRWSRILDRHGQTASAGSVLRTYLTCKPTDLSAQQRYQRLLIRLGCLSGV